MPSTSRGVSCANRANHARVTRSALVTGAAGGLAAGIAPALARDGFSCVAISYRSTPPDETMAAVAAAGASTAAVRIDFLDERATIERALHEAARAHGPFDTLVHAVGPLVVKRFASDDARRLSRSDRRKLAQRRFDRPRAPSGNAGGRLRPSRLLRDARFR